MSSIVDVAVATGITVVFIAIIINLILNFFLNINSISQSNELTTVGLAVSNMLLGGKGLPSDWELRNDTPIIVGLTNDLNRVIILVGETNGSSQNNVTVNVTVQFDFHCTNKTWETSVRLFDENKTERQFNFYNKTVCNTQYLNKSDIVFNVTLTPNDLQNFFLYYSNDREINSTFYPTIAFPSNMRNISVTVFPTETFAAISVSKLRALRQLTYSDILQTLGLDSHFKIEVAEK